MCVFTEEHSVPFVTVTYSFFRPVALYCPVLIGSNSLVARMPLMVIDEMGCVGDGDGIMTFW